MFLKPFRAIFMLPKNQQRSADRYAFAQSESLQDGSEATTVRLLGEGEGRPPPSAILSIITLGAPHQENIYSHRSSAAASSLHLKWFQQTQLAL